MTDQTLSPKSKIDCHVHMVGNGYRTSGCTLDLRGWRHYQARLMLFLLGLNQQVLKGDLENAFVGRLLEMIKDSSLDAVVLLAMERAYSKEGRLLTTQLPLYVSNDVVLNLAKEHPCFLPGVAIHPAREDALEELSRCAELGARVLKILPNCQNIEMTSDANLRFWELMAKKRMVLLCHTGGELSLPVIATQFQDPDILLAPLEAGVTVIAAHCGTSSLWERNYLEKFLLLLEKYPRLYGDNSGMMTPVRSRHLRSLLSSSVRDRIIHGSDIPIPISARWAAVQRLISFREAARIQKITNILERDLEIKRAIGFPEETFTRLAGILYEG